MFLYWVVQRLQHCAKKLDSGRKAGKSVTSLEHCCHITQVQLPVDL